MSTGPVSTEPGSVAQLDEYLRQWRERLARAERVRAAAWLALAALLLSLGCVALAMRHGFGAAWMGGGRALLVVALAALAWWGLHWRVQRLRRGLARAIETRVPELDGRAGTWLEQQAADAAGQRNPLLPLLAEDTLAIARQHEPRQRLSFWSLWWPAPLAGAALLALLWFATLAPGLWGAGVRQLWAGWAISGLLPVQALKVTPGDTAVRRGGNLAVVAQPQGFAPADAQLFARIGQGAWQQVAMTRAARGFNFTFLSLREPVQYYVTASGVRSSTYDVRVVDVPNIESLKLVYHYPGWTRRKDETHEPGGDVTAVAGTRIEVQARTDVPLQNGALVLDGTASTLQGGGQNSSGSFEVQHDGRYYLAARVGSETVRLTDDYLITAQPDTPPQVRVVRPARDTNASSIEEVAADVEASDDFALESLQLRYAVNGGSWQSIELPKGGTETKAEALMALEGMKDASGRALEPGDLISYYAVARDRSQTAQTDMYFVDVRPFDRSYEQSQQAGGGGGGGGAGDQSDEISQRQKQIIVSTWNLLRQQRGNDARAAQVGDNARVLAQLQRTLAEQARSLTGRSNSRELSDDSADIQRFVDYMTRATEAMVPAAARLSAVELEQAIQPEQQALQQLLRAEAVFRDVQVAMQQGGGGAGGGQSGRDLSQIYELEMDLQKNQYETGSSAQPGSASQQQEDELTRKLQELARRQEQLANQMRQQPNSPEQRWQQEALQREAQQLQQQLQQQQLQRSGQSGQQGQSAQQGQPGASGQSGAAGQSAAGQSGASAQNGSAAGAAASGLENAIRSMSAANDALRSGGEQARERSEQAARAASQQLNSAGNQVNQQRQAQLQRSLGELAQRSSDLYEKQAAGDTELQQSVERAGNSDAAVTSGGLNAEQRQRLAAQKRQLAGNLESLQSDLATTTQQLRAADPNGARSLQQAQQSLGESEVGARLSVAAQYIERGRAGFIASSESVVTDELRNLRDTLRRVAAQPGGGAANGGNDDALNQALARVQNLRQQLQQLADARQQQQAQTAQQSAQGSQQNQPGQSANAQGQGGNGQANAGQPGAGQGTAQGGAGTAPAGLAGQLRGVGRAVGGVAPLLAGNGATTEEQNQVRALAEQLQGAQLGGAQLQAQLTRNLKALEQLELQLRRSGAQPPLRSAASEPGTEEYEAAVAEYYRELSR
ncbi:MAG: hypothetical protein QM718_08940 [Steroidobacteraceae bacterium]